MNPQEFKIGDRVKAWGNNAKVRDDADTGPFPIRVEFDNGSTESFTRDGRSALWHKTPSLKHRKFKKRPVLRLREFWVVPSKPYGFASKPDGFARAFNTLEEAKDFRVYDEVEIIHTCEIREG